MSAKKSLILVFVIAFLSAVSSASAAPVVEAPQATAIVLSQTGEGKETTEEQVRAYFSDVPILAEVAQCESHFRHFGENGDVIRGLVNESDIGVMQINEYYHGDTADTLGLDLHKFGDNLVYARNLYEREGLQPWSASSKCWSKHLHLAKN